MTTRISLLCGIISLLIVIFSEYKIHFAVVGIIAFAISWVSHGINSRNTGIDKQIKTTTAETPKLAPLVFTPEHISILKVFRSNDGELTSAPFIKNITGLEIIIITTILDELEKHGVIQATNLDELNGGWQYQLSEKGRKTTLENT